MQHVVYVGPYEAVEVPELRARVVNGDAVEVDDATAQRLLAQEGVWRSQRSVSAEEAAEERKQEKPKKGDTR